MTNKQKKNTWLPALEAILLELREVKQMKWEEISLEMGRSRTSCQARYGKLRPLGSRVRIFRRNWTEEAEETLRRLRFDEHWTLHQIAQFLGRTRASIEAKLERRRNGSRPRFTPEVVSRSVVPQSCLDDRERRFAAGLRDLTALFCGDPPIGFSALDKRRALA